MYRNILISQVAASVGEVFLMIALASLAFQITGSPVQAAWVVSISALATFTMGLVAGWFIDKFPKKHLMLICDILRVFLITPLFFISKENFWLVYIIVFLISCCNSVFHPSREGYIQSQFDKDERLEIVSSVQSYLSLISLIGPTIAGILIAILTPSISFVINLTAFIISTFFIMKIPKDTPVSDSTPEKFWRKITSGWVYLYKNKPLLRLNINRIFLTSALAIYVIVNYSYLASIVNQPIFKFTLTFPILLGLVNSIQGTGALIGGIVVKKNKKRISNNFEKLLIYAGIVFAIGFILWIFENIYLIVLGSFFIGFGLIIGRTGISLLGQSLADSMYIGRAITAGDAIARLCNISVTSLTSILIMYFSPKLLIGLSAVLAIAISINYLTKRKVEENDKSTNRMFNS
ncbi:MFS transporter [Lysinibacillus sphaericus]|uniref:MFS transporter n=1 Tax=Lysinibacillus sphaericus TaxID=1421 RepID=UPI0022A835BB|nr:MFS transporter [Lysinibacillus sphaericus]